jgi:release factor glutamine methyltransferase
MYAGNIARELVCAASGKTQEALIADRGLYASEEICLRVENFVQRHLTGEPTAYILGQWDFYDMTLTVTPDVLIPRDDSMAVTELAIKKALFLPQNPRILDLCTGSGCIGLALARRVKDAKLTLADVSPEALRVAKKNVTDLHLGGRVSCVHADALKPAAPFLGKFDLIVSNPPYVTTAEMESLDSSVKDFEPHLALHGGEDGLDFYRRITAECGPFLKAGAYLMFEIGCDQAEAVCSLMKENGFENVTVRQDLAGLDRVVYGRKRPV